MLIRVNAVSAGTAHTTFVDPMLQGFPDPEAERAALPPDVLMRCQVLARQ